MYFNYLIFIPIILIIVIGAVVGAVFRVTRKKIPSPQESEESFLFLQKEVKKWQKEGIIEESQAQKIIERYLPFREERKALKAQTRLIRIFSFFGTILIGIGIILFIAANWGTLPPWVTTSLLILATIGIYFSGWWLKYERKNHPLIGAALIFLGSLLFGADLILISQLYHIRIEYSNLILVWALAILPLAYFAKSSPVLGLSSILTLSWGIFSFYSERTMWVRETYFPPQYYLSLLLILGIIAPLSYRLRSIKVQNLNVAEILVWLGIIASLNWFKESSNIAVDISFFFLVIGGLIFLLGEGHSRFEKYKAFQNIYFSFGLWLIFLFSYILTFPQVYEIGRRGTPFMAVLFNFILFGEICGAIYLGITRKTEYFVNLATLFFGLLVFVRYFSLTWTLGARASVFILGGIILIIGSYFIDKARRKILARIQQ